MSAPGRFEYRSVDSMVNPYLMGSTILAAADDGIDNNLDPGRNPRNAISTKRSRPARMLSACRCRLGRRWTRWHRTKLLNEGLPGEMFRLYHEYKTDEWERFMHTRDRLGRRHLYRLPSIDVGRRQADPFPQESVGWENLNVRDSLELIHRGSTSEIGSEMTSMLNALKHRGPDSTGFAVYGTGEADNCIMRFKVAEQEDMGKGHGILDRIEDRIAKVDAVLEGARRHGQEPNKGHRIRVAVRFSSK